MKKIITKLIEQTILEFKKDLKKQCVVMMGLPASGKSYFVKHDLPKIVSNFKDFNTSNSDIQVKRVQYEKAKNDYDLLVKSMEGKSEEAAKKILLQFAFKNQYTDNDNQNVQFPVTYDWWKSNANKGFLNYYNTFNKEYYASYFKDRAVAKEFTKQGLKNKIYNSSNILIIDTVGANPDPLFSDLEKIKEAGYNVTLIFLDIDKELSIKRDLYRKGTEGRGVGKPVIDAYDKVIKPAWDRYVKEANQKAGLIDRIFHYVWVPEGDSVIKGRYKLIYKHYRIKD